MLMWGFVVASAMAWEPPGLLLDLECDVAGEFVVAARLDRGLFVHWVLDPVGSIQNRTGHVEFVLQTFGGTTDGVTYGHGPLMGEGDSVFIAANMGPDGTLYQDNATLYVRRRYEAFTSDGLGMVFADGLETRVACGHIYDFDRDADVRVDCPMTRVPWSAAMAMLHARLERQPARWLMGPSAPKAPAACPDR